MQQLTLSYVRDPRDERHRGDDRNAHVFPPPDTQPSPLSNLVYLDFLNGLTLADLTYLFDRASPPNFAGQLTHFALRVHWTDRAAAAALLLSLPSLYPSLTHVHVDVKSKQNNGRLPECAEWDAAVRVVRAELDSAWCDSVDEVMACREDVAWRRSVGLAAQEL